MSADRAAISDGVVVQYDRTSIALHWVTAVLVVALWGIAQVIDDFSKGTPRVAARSVHILLGALLVAVLLTRIVWRTTSGARLRRANPGLFGLLAAVVHYGLYVLLGVTLLLGIANASQRGDSFFGLFHFPRFAPGNEELQETIQNLHGLAANTTLIVAGLHAVAGLAHHYILRDEVLGRMLPRRRTPR